MTMPDERTRALLWAGSFLIELARDKALPLRVRRRAVVIARHFPTVEEISLAARLGDRFGGIGLEVLSQVAWKDQCPCGPLTYSTRLRWPED